MASTGNLVPPEQDASKQEFWVETWKRIDRFLPELRKDLALDAPQEKATATDDRQAGMELETKPETKPETKSETETEAKNEGDVA